MPNRRPNEIRELDRKIQQLQRYLYNFYIKKIKKLAVAQSLPVEFFRKQYENEIEVNIRKYIEDIYQGSTQALEKKLKKLSKKLRVGKSTEEVFLSSIIFTSLKDIDNIRRLVAEVKEKYFNSVGRLISRLSTTKIDSFTHKEENLTPFSEQAAFNRVSSFAGYSTYNNATISKIDQLNLAVVPATTTKEEDRRAIGIAVGTGIGLAIDTSTSLFLQNALNAAMTITVGFRYVTAQDERVCPICSPYDSQVFEENDPSIPDLPQHENCRCFLEVII